MQEAVATVRRTPQATPARAWPAWAPMLFVTAAVAAIYAKTMADLASEWWNVDASSYGLLIPPLALYIAYLRRKALFLKPATPDLRGLAVTGAACLIFLVGGLSAEFYLSRISIVLLLAGLILTFWGMERLKTLAFPLVLLATMVPLPAIVYNSVAAPLQLFASNAATSIAQLLGVSVYCEGNIIHLAQVSLGVEEACSGLQSLSALTVASLLLGYLEDASILGRFILFALAPPLAVGVNVLRVAGTALLADYKLEFAMGFYHLFSGWLVFVLGFGFLWVVAKGIFRLTKVQRV